MLMKLTTIIKVSKSTRNIQRSNEHVQIIQDVRVWTTDISLVFSTISKSILITIWRWDGNNTRPHCHKTKRHSHGFSTDDKGW